MLRQIEEGNKNTNAAGLINFQKRRLVAAVLRDVAQAGVGVSPFGEGRERRGGELLAPLSKLIHLPSRDPVPRPCRRVAGGGAVMGGGLVRCLVGGVRVRQRLAARVMLADLVVGFRGMNYGGGHGDENTRSEFLKAIQPFMSD